MSILEMSFNGQIIAVRSVRGYCCSFLSVTNLDVEPQTGKFACSLREPIETGPASARWNSANILVRPEAFRQRISIGRYIIHVTCGLTIEHQEPETVSGWEYVSSGLSISS